MTNEIAKFKNTILKEYPRYTKNDSFQFACHRNLKCFNSCCADVNIFLTPYDILRMRKHLGITSEEFLDKYTLIPIDKNLKYPAILLKMSETEEKRCEFVSESEGCTIYENRPWACRMYPVGLASPKDGEAASEEEFYFILEDQGCDGFKEGKKWTIKEWIENQGIDEYNRLGEAFKEIILHEKMQDDSPLDPKKIEMFHMVCYNLDTFRRFVFESSFLKKFEVDEYILNEIRKDDIELMLFGFEWLKFSLFGEPTMKIKPDVLQEKLKSLETKK